MLSNPICHLRAPCLGCRACGRSLPSSCVHLVWGVGPVAGASSSFCPVVRWNVNVFSSTQPTGKFTWRFGGALISTAVVQSRAAAPNLWGCPRAETPNPGEARLGLHCHLVSHNISRQNIRHEGPKPWRFFPVPAWPGLEVFAWQGPGAKVGPIVSY